MATNSSSNIQNALEASNDTFTAALWTNAAIFGAILLVFTLLRPYLRLIYEPRSLLPIESKRQDPLVGNILKWPVKLFHEDYTKVKRANGMDAYFFLRFLRMLIRIFLPIWLLSWAVLLPVNSVNTQVGDHQGLDRLTFGNVEKKRNKRFIAHILCLYVFTFWILYNIRYEMRHFVSSRQHYLTSLAHSNTAQSRTVLITGIPSRYLTERQLFNLFSYLPGGLHQVWLNRDLKDLPDLFEARESASRTLESAETSLLSSATKAQAKQDKSKAEGKGEGKVAKAANPPTEKRAGGGISIDDGTRPLNRPTSYADEQGVNSDQDPEQGRMSRAEELVPRHNRPTHRLPLFSWLPFGLPLIGQKVDSIDWARAEIVRCNEALAKGRAQWREDMATDEDSASDYYQPLNSAFLLFNQQIAAHMALQCVSHHEPYRMASKHIEVAPDDIIWDNLGLNPYEQRIRTVISFAATVGLIIAWSIPVAFVGAISNINYLCSTYTWLHWLCDLPDAVRGMISGVLPPVLLATLMALLPIILRLLIRFEGVPNRNEIELKLMNRFFGFQVVHSFLIVTISAGLIKALPDLAKDPTGIPNLLATNLPGASNFFLTYVILQGLSGTATGFLQAVTLLLYYVKIFLLASTPRAVYDVKFGPRKLAWGTLFPTVTLLTTITIAYSVISPIINGLACATFFLFYMLYKYLLLWIMQMPPAGDTGGLFFPKAMNHLFVGLYIQHICLAALFFLLGKRGIILGAMTIVLLGLTVLFHLAIIDSYSPLIHALPLTLADRTYGLRAPDAPNTPGSPGAPVPEGEKPAIAANGNPGTAVVQAMAAEAERTPDEAEAEDKGDGKASGVDRFELQPRRTGSGAEPKRGRSGDAASSRSAFGEEGTAASVLAEPQADAADVDEGPTDFTHPAVGKAPPTVWLPVDPLGLWEDEVAQARALGISVSVEGAHMNEKGHVGISGAPPDLDRYAM